MSRVRIFLTVLLIVGVCTVIVEVAFRYILLPERFIYLESSYARQPKVRLMETFNVADVDIRSHRRHVTHDKARDKAVAVIGDSVAFGSLLNGKDVLAQLLQDRQNRFNVSNFGVPGYGLRDYLTVIRSLPKDAYDVILVQISSNDPYPARSGRLGLLADADDTTLFFNDYADGPLEPLKGFLFRNLKAVYFSALVLSSQTERQNFLHGSNKRILPNFKEEANIICATDHEHALASSTAHQKVLAAERRIYGDAYALEKIRSDLKLIRDAAAATSKHLILIQNYSYAQLALPNHPYVAAVDQLADELGIEKIRADFEVHRRNFRKCGYFNDPGHPGPVYNDLLANIVADRLVALD